MQVDNDGLVRNVDRLQVDNTALAQNLRLENDMRVSVQQDNQVL